jgi:hypothetical protein
MFWGLSLSFYTKIEHCINIRDVDLFVFRSAWSGPSIEPSNQRLVASILKSLSLIDHCLPSTIQTTHVSLLAKALGFIKKEFSTRNNKVCTLLWITY